jgi:nucleotide-binding universal stress UspA family protein
MTENSAHNDRRIVVGVDGSEPSKAALRWAELIARSTASTIDVVTAWEYPLSAGGWTALPTDWRPAEEAEKLASATVDEVFGPYRPPGLTVRVVEGNATRVLLDAGRGAHMLILGGRGHGGFVGMLLGSVSNHTAAHAHCPVLVVHGDFPKELDTVPAT